MLFRSVKDEKINGDYIFYYENGQVGKKGNTILGKENGTWTHYTENGKIELIENYENGEIGRASCRERV